MLVVDGEAFAVRVDDDGVCDCVWLTAPGPGYGFSTDADRVTHRAHADPATDARIEEEIRFFLLRTDPTTGRLRD
jgi:hypothetical protein